MNAPMKDERDLLRATVADLLAEHCTAERVAAAPRDGWDATLWRVLEETGLTLVGSPEDAGGSGGDLAAAADIAVAAGAAAAPVPLAETLAAGMLLARAGLDIPAGPLTLAVTADRDAPLRRVPYGRLATTVAVGRAAGSGAVGSAAASGAVAGSGAAAAGSGAAGDWLVVIGRPGRVTPGRNLAGEPRDVVVPGPGAEVRQVPPGTADYARRLVRLFRSLLIAGAAQRALDLTVAYVNEREQFGRALARFATVQQEIARMAGEVALISAATQAAVAAEQADVTAGQTDVAAEQAGSGAGGVGVAAEQAGPGAGGVGVLSAVLAAKAQASENAGIVAAIAHQLHGAIGTTEEHRLRLTTTRLWSWRDEDGTAAECFAELGQAALGAAHRRRGGLWPWLTGDPGT
jgi:acyl-CoA dehydrogenase